MKRDIAQELTKMVQETITEAKMDPKNQDLQDLLIDHCLTLVKSKLSTDDVYDVKEDLLKREQAALKDLRQKTRAEKKACNPEQTRA